MSCIFRSSFVNLVPCIKCICRSSMSSFRIKFVVVCKSFVRSNVVISGKVYFCRFPTLEFNSMLVAVWICIVFSQNVSYIVVVIVVLPDRKKFQIAIVLVVVVDIVKFVFSISILRFCRLVTFKIHIVSCFGLI